MKSLLLAVSLSLLTQVASAMSLHCEGEEFTESTGNSEIVFTIDKEMTRRDHQGTITYSTSAIEKFKGATVTIMALSKNMMTLEIEFQGMKSETIGTASANLLLQSKELILSVQCSVAE